MKDLDFLKNKIIAHRGIFDNKKVPENSIKAFKDAVNKKHTIEFDIHLTKDNKIVVFHDDTLDRMTNKTGSISKYTLEELTNIKLLDTNYCIPSLNEVLELVDGKVGVLIEFKTNGINHRLEKEFIKEIENYKGEFAVQSFNPYVVNYFKKKKNNYIRGLLVSPKKNTIKNKILNKMLFVPICKPDFLSVYKSMYNNSKVKKFKNKGPVFAWTVKTKEEMNDLKNKYDNLIVNIGEII